MADSPHLDDRRDEIFEHWEMHAQRGDTRYVGHPTREWLNEHCKIRDIAPLLPDDIQTVDHRSDECLELFWDHLAQYDHEEGELIPLGRSWDICQWENGEVADAYGPLSGFESAIEKAVSLSREIKFPVLRYSSVVRFPNEKYRKQRV